MNNRINKKAVVESKGGKRLFFLLAILMLVVSCPFKRLLINSPEQQISWQSSSKWKSAEKKIAAEKNLSCCLQKQKQTLVNQVVSKQEIPAPDFVASPASQKGFAIPYFLSGTKTSLFFAISLDPLPLFLTNRRLLI